jgi:hypothetical protein
MLARRCLRNSLAIGCALTICTAGLAMSCEAEPSNDRRANSQPPADSVGAPNDLARIPADALAVLQKFVGDWQTETHLTRPGAAPEKPAPTIDTRGTATCQPTLGGRYFEFRAETLPPGQADLQVMTFDTEAGVYRQWVFSSDGYRHEATGTWNAATNTLRWTGKSGDTSFVILDHWVSADRLEWTLTRSDAEGKVVQTITGVVSRAEDLK